MTGPEKGFLLLTSQLGNPDRKPLTVAQLRILTSRASLMHRPKEVRDLTVVDLVEMGYGGEMARRILGLLSEEVLLDRYLRRGADSGCVPLSRVTPGYPAAVRHRLGLDSPGCLWYKGDIALLDTPKISLVGSRALNRENLKFAWEAGHQAALQGFTLVSGNAVGADQAAQQACLESGGSVICVIADELRRHQPKERVIYLAEDDYDVAFSAQRALSRNRVIHCLGKAALVAQSGLEKGGTWDGTVRNLRLGFSPVFCFDDGSEASKQLAQMGAVLITVSDLKDLEALPWDNKSLFDQ